MTGTGTTTPPSRTAPSLLYAIKQVELAIRAQLDDLLKPAGVTTAQYTALTVLDRRDGLTTAELARNSFVTPQTMADLVTALERGELIDRHPDPAHRRRTLIKLTPRGRTLLADVDDLVRGLEERMLADLDRGERSTLRDALNRCRAALATSPPQ
ncbi:MarR family winged helix-turn-helix transcriptional regulator [Pseudonocardia sp. GCM10023141]|uniref:MarR family winged helix-turn-helix transcriptional regulator n=1 Tax=Pseudonocardia sp. GCM10023141 TaxID=3252653 RepID=UPI003617DB77